MNDRIERILKRLTTARTMVGEYAPHVFRRRYAEDVGYLLQELDRARAQRDDRAAQFFAVRRERDSLRATLTTISDIRDSIIGGQKVNWSEHIYPLVAALDAAGFQGAGYEIARKDLGTLIEQTAAAERERDEARERVKALEKEAALDLDAMREALAATKQQRGLVDRLFAEAKGWHDQAASDRARLRRLEEWADRIVNYDDGSMTVSVLESAAREVLSIIRGGGE